MGRPRTALLDERVVTTLLRAVASGLSPHRAAIVAGIPPTTMRSRMAADPEFSSSVKKAEATAEASFLARLVAHSERNWIPCAWLLERRFPERWARVDRDFQRPNTATGARALLATLHEIKANSAGEAQPRTDDAAPTS